MLFVTPWWGYPRGVVLALGGACHVTHTLRGFMSLTVALVLSVLVCLFLQGFVNVLTLEGCYLLHGPGWACYVTHARSVHVLESCISFS